MKKKRKLKIWHVIVGLLLFAIYTLVADTLRNSNIEVRPQRPAERIELQQNQLYYALSKGQEDIDWNMLEGTLEYISNEYDCSDFRLVNLVRILYDFGDRIPADLKKKTEEVLYNFRYWWDEPGENSMCYWSENHQILFASAEYLIGQLYPEQVFTSSGLTGQEHMDKARQRTLDWMQMRWDHGFIEYYSSVYYKEDIGALINLIDFAKDEELVKKSMIMMDLLFYDIASQSSGTMFSSVSGRAYQGNRMGRESAEFSGLTNYLWGDSTEIGPHMMYGMMLSEKYSVPPVFREIALDTSTVVIRASNGLDLVELKPEGYYGTDNRSMMMQWGMESFTNPEIIRNTLIHMENTRMFSNNFLKDFAMINYRLLRWLRLEPAVSRMLNPVSNGVAIQKGNTYTYRCKDFMMYTVQDHEAGDFADQQHIFGMNVGQHFSIFHNHPAAEKDVNKQSPNYWVGYGRFPHSMQEGRVNLSIYNIPDKKGFMESHLLDYTRAYFPSADFDTCFVEDNYVFGRLEDTYVAMIGASSFEWRDESRDDLLQQGKQSFWITEAGNREEDGSFDAFVSRIRRNMVEFDPTELSLSYGTAESLYELDFQGDFRVNGQVIDTSYPRYDSPYVQGERKDGSFSYSHNGLSLHLDFENMVREF